jgi:SAM-dependent methyltransferase
LSDRPSSTYHASSGEAYERFLGRWTRRLAAPFVEFANPPAAGELLDVGCGTGSVAAALVGRFPGRRVVGIDIAEPYVSYALSQVSIDGVSFELGDATRLRWQDGHFTAALSQLVLNFIPNCEAAAREMRRVTRRGGVLAAAVWDFRGGLVYQRLFWDTAVGVDPAAAATRDRLYSGALALPDGLVGLWRRIGLDQVERASLTIRMDYADFADYWEPLLGGQGPVGTYVDRLAPALRARVQDAVRLAYLSGAPDGPRSLTATAWAVRGVVP